MATVTKDLADLLADNDGYYADDPRVVKIIEYENGFDGRKAYGLLYPRDHPDRYAESEYVRNPRVYWSRETGRLVPK